MPYVIHLQENDDWAVLRGQLRHAPEKRVIIDLPWDARLLVRPLDVDLVLREAERLGLHVAVVSSDPERRAMLRQAGLPAFATLERAEASSWARKKLPSAEPPPRAWWEEPLPLWPPPGRRFMPRWARHARRGLQALVFIATIAFLLLSAYVVVPQASITMTPDQQTVQVIVPVSVSTDPEQGVDVNAGVIPARQVGDYFEGYLQVETTGLAPFSAGRATGTVLFTNLLGQDVSVPAGTTVRTSAGSFPVRFATTATVVVPAFGQATAPVEALQEGLVGNVRSNQINQIEGFLAFSLRVTNPEATSGGATQDVRAVSEEDRQRAQALLIDQLLDEARTGLQVYLEGPSQFLLDESLTVQAMEVSFDRFLYERADRLGVHMRLLVTALVVDGDDAEAVAYAALTRRIPAGYRLISADFEMGEVAEESSGAGLTFFVTATGRIAAEIDTGYVREAVVGRPLAEAVERLSADLPVSRAVRVTVWPDWLERMPLLPLRIDTEIILE